MPPKIDLRYDEERDFWYLYLGATLEEANDFLNRMLYLSDCAAALNKIVGENPEIKKKYVGWAK